VQRYFPPKQALRRYKKFALYFSANFKFAHSFYNRIHNAPDLETVKTELDAFFDRNPERVRRPNMNFFV
jgi:hypothetical protein